MVNGISKRDLPVCLVHKCQVPKESDWTFSAISELLVTFFPSAITPNTRRPLSLSTAESLIWRRALLRCVSSHFQRFSREHPPSSGPLCATSETSPNSTRHFPTVPQSWLKQNLHSIKPTAVSGNCEQRVGEAQTSQSSGLPMVSGEHLEAKSWRRSKWGSRQKDWPPSVRWRQESWTQFEKRGQPQLGTLRSLWPR